MNTDLFFSTLTTKINYNSDKIINFLIVFFISIIIIIVVKKLLSISLSKFSVFTKNNIDNIISNQVNRISYLLIIFSSFFIAINIIDNQLSKSSGFKFINLIFYFWWTIEIVQLINKIIKEVVNVLVKRTKDKSIISAYTFLSIALRVLMYTLGTLFVLSNLGFDVNTFIAGLGIGGLAVALALQNILRDLFSSLLILSDKPIRINDYVIIGDIAGIVKEIGIRSTRLISDEGSEIIIPNGDLVNRTIRNYKSRKYQKVIFNLIISSKEDSNSILDYLYSTLSSMSSLQENTLSIFLIQKNEDELTLKIAFNLIAVDNEKLPIVLQRLMNKLYLNIISQKYIFKILSLENPKL